ncbi:Hypothetical predicted protein, partial [Pelobates cultripes]
MQTPKDHPSTAPTLAESVSRHPITTEPGPQSSQGDDLTPMEQLNSEELHSLLDATMTRSVTRAIYSAIGTMSDTLYHSITNAIMASNRKPDVPQPKAPENKPIAQGGRKATAKTHHLGAHASKTDFTD